MADTTTTAGADAYAGQKITAAAANPANKAPADQLGYDPKDAKWDNVPGAAARQKGYPRSS